VNWYYKDGDSKVGPVSDEQIRHLASQGKIKPETKVWNELISKWLPYGEIIGSNSTAPPKTTQPGLPAPEKAEESARDSYADLDAGNTVHKSGTFLIGNFVLTLITLGLYWPWAAVRLSRYRAETMALMVDRNLDTFTADAASDMSAAGEEISDACGFDVSF